MPNISTPGTTLGSNRGSERISRARFVAGGLACLDTSGPSAGNAVSVREARTVVPPTGGQFDSRIISAVRAKQRIDRVKPIGRGQMVLT
jgi:hypothetical protein